MLAIPTPAKHARYSELCASSVEVFRGTPEPSSGHRGETGIRNTAPTRSEDQSPGQLTDYRDGILTFFIPMMMIPVYVKLISVEA